MPKRAPKKWWDKKTAEIRPGLKQAHPDWSKDKLDKTTRQTVGKIWHNELSDSKRKEILKRHEGNPGSLWNDFIIPLIIGSVIATLIIIFILWLKSVKAKPPAPPPEPECVIDGDCPTGFICQDGVCIPEGEQPPDPLPPPPEPECVTDAECPPGEICDNGVCVPEPAPPPPPPPPPGVCTPSNDDPASFDYIVVIETLCSGIFCIKVTFYNQLDGLFWNVFFSEATYHTIIPTLNVLFDQGMLNQSQLDCGIEKTEPYWGA